MRSDTNGEAARQPDTGELSEGGYLTLSQAAATLPGRPHLSTLHLSTLHRWRLRGVRGVRLRTCLVGGRRFTRREWLGEFIKASSEAGDQHAAAKSEPSKGRDQAIRAAEAELDAAGI